MAEENYELLNRRLKVNYIFSIRIVLFVLGIFILAFGAATMIKSSLGTATWEVLHIGLANATGLSIGSCVQIVGIAMVLMTCFLEKEKPALGSLLNILIVGFFLNSILNFGLVPNFADLLPRFIMLILGSVLMGIGSGMYVASKVGAGPRDGITLFLAKRFSISVRLARTLLEISAIASGWLIGGPVTVGTFVSIPLIGPVMQASLKYWTSFLNKLSGLVNS